MENDESEKKKGFFAKFGAYCKSRKKQAAIVCVLCVFALTAAGIGSYNAIVGDATQGGDKTVTIIDKDTGKEKVVKADSEEAKEAEENGDVIKETTQPTKPAHTHSYTQPIYEYNTYEVMICSGCGWRTSDGNAMISHTDKDPFDSCDGYYSDVATEKKLVGYKCSCGATK